MNENLAGLIQMRKQLKSLKFKKSDHVKNPINGVSNDHHRHDTAPGDMNGCGTKVLSSAPGNACVRDGGRMGDGMEDSFLCSGAKCSVPSDCTVSQAHDRHNVHADRRLVVWDNRFYRVVSHRRNRIFRFFDFFRCTYFSHSYCQVFYALFGSTHWRFRAFSGLSRVLTPICIV